MFFNHSASNESTARACSAGLGLCVPCALLGDLDPRLRAQREFGHLQMARVRRPDECEELRETLNKGASRVLCCAWQGPWSTAPSEAFRGNPVVEMLWF